MDLQNFQPTPLMLAGMLAAGVVLLILAMLLRARTDSPRDRLSTSARVFLVLLRITIGWHFLIEGIEKFNTPNWSSEGYLREAVGPLAPKFRELAGDSLIAQLTTDGKSVPPALADEWGRYLDAFTTYYKLDADTTAKANAILDKAKTESIVVADPKTKAESPGWLVMAKSMSKPSTYPPPIAVEWTMAQRLEHYETLKKNLEKAESKLPEEGQDAWPAWLSAKADLAKWRAELKSDLDRAAAGFKDELNKLLSAEQQLKANDLKKTKSKKLEPTPRPIDWSRHLDVSDTIVKYGLVSVGVGLIAGCFTRLAAVCGAILLLSFYLAMPPMPYLPDSPKAEGHYLFINKNIIEMFALLALASLPTGRWAGVDGLLQFLNPFNWRRQKPK